MDERNSARASCTSALHPMAGSLPDRSYEDDASSNVAALQGILPSPVLSLYPFFLCAAAPCCGDTKAT